MTERTKRLSRRNFLLSVYQAMRTGQVDEAWAKEHHEHWYDEIRKA